MNLQIQTALLRLFERHRIIFWYDAKRELHSDFCSVELEDIKKIEIANNEYSIKYRILREEPKQKFLLYREGEQPADLDNWLLDVQLAHGEFRTDQVSIWLSDLELGSEFSDVVQEHVEFMQAKRRKDALRKLLKPDDTSGAIRMKMLSVCAGSEPRLDSVLESLLQEESEGKDEKQKLITRCNLDEYLWEQMCKLYGYKSETPGIKDFAIELFKSCYAMGTDGTFKLTSDALVFLKRWKDSRQFEQAFETLSEECASILSIEQDLGNRDIKTLLDLDYFRLIDQKIISDLVGSVISRTLTSGDTTLWIRQRRQSHWYKEFHHLYDAIDNASRFYQTLSEAKLDLESLSDGIQKYCQTWHRVDQLYRKFTYHSRMSGQTSLLGELANKVEDLYSNNFLLNLGNSVQVQIDKLDKWDASPILSQKNFFDRCVQPVLSKGNKVCVIISDAMRYEVGDELLSLIRQEDRYSAEIKGALSSLPSYTQLGMASLLPNKIITIAENDTGIVVVDGISSQGTHNRAKILDASTSRRTTACKADDVMGMNREECRNFLKENDVIYVYHNRIDATGDKRESEERVFEACEETLQDLIRLVKKLTAANATNLYVTADHGFIYQNRTIDDSDFSGDDAKGENILFKDRRFVLGTGLKEAHGFRKFTSSQLGLKGAMEVLVPKSINRLRLKGSGSRYVHGGASLQEVVIPVIKINKKRQSDVSSVEVDILRGSSQTITSGQIAITLYQSSPITEKMQPRKLRAGIYTESGDIISDVHELEFDLDSENPREREIQLRLVLTRDADKSNGKEVIFRLDEKHGLTSHYQEYKSLRYVMRRSFTSDFDF